MVTFVLLLRPSRLPYETGRLRDHLASRHRQRQGSQRQKAGDQHVRQLGGFRDLSTAQPQWSRPQQRCQAPIDRRQPGARFAALLRGSVDATVVNSPFEYRAEQKGLKVLLSIKEIAEFVKFPINGLSSRSEKLTERPMKSGGCCGRCATPICFCKISARSVQG
jgi:hypothetical protein